MSEFELALWKLCEEHGLTFDGLLDRLACIVEEERNQQENVLVRDCLYDCIVYLREASFVYYASTK